MAHEYIGEISSDEEEDVHDPGKRQAQVRCHNEYVSEELSEEFKHFLADRLSLGGWDMLSRANKKLIRDRRTRLCDIHKATGRHLEPPRPLTAEETKKISSSSTGINLEVLTAWAEFQTQRHRQQQMAHDKTCKDKGKQPIRRGLEVTEGGGGATVPLASLTSMDIDESSTEDTDPKGFLIGFGNRDWANHAELLVGENYDFGEPLFFDRPDARLTTESEGSRLYLGPEANRLQRFDSLLREQLSRCGPKDDLLAKLKTGMSTKGQALVDLPPLSQLESQSLLSDEAILDDGARARMRNLIRKITDLQTLLKESPPNSSLETHVKDILLSEFDPWQVLTSPSTSAFVLYRLHGNVAHGEVGLSQGGESSSGTLLSLVLYVANGESLASRAEPMEELVTEEDRLQVEYKVCVGQQAGKCLLQDTHFFQPGLKWDAVRDSLTHGIVRRLSSRKEEVKVKTWRFQGKKKTVNKDSWASAQSSVAATVSLVAIIDEASQPETTDDQDERKNKYTLHPEQAAVSGALMERVNACVDLSSFLDVEFIILTPRFKTLQDQTAMRVKNAGLIRPGENVVDRVLQYDKAAVRSAFGRFKQSALDHADILHVIVADECHWGPVRGQAHDLLLNDAQLDKLPNVLALLVSATPHNCLTQSTRVKSNNIVVWREEVAKAHPDYVSSYRGLDDNLISAGFRIPEGRVLFVTGLRDGVRPERREVALDPHAIFCTYRDVAEYLEKRVADSFGPEYATLGIRWDPSASRFVIARARALPCVLLDSSDKALGEQSILPLLGFTKQQAQDLRDDTLVAAAGSPTVDEQQPLRSQRLRQDEMFEYAFKKYEEAFLIQDEGARVTIGTAQPVGKAAIQLYPSRGHFMIVDYMFALAYFATFRVDKNWCTTAYSPDKPILTAIDPQQSVPARYNATNAQEFFKKLRDVCKLESTAANTKCSYDLEPIMRFLIEIRCKQARKELQDGEASEEGERKDSVGSSSTREPSDEECLLYIAEELYKAEQRDDTTAMEFSWYTETERNVRTLLTRRTHDDCGRPLGYTAGFMILLRLQDSDQNLCFQDTLRNALVKLGLTAQHGEEKLPAFSVLSDIASTTVATHLEDASYNVALRPESEKEPRTLNEMKVWQDHGGKLDYQDLLNLPILVILCERGRLGDTFPESFTTFDLRARSSGTLTTMIQELGRLCRYPSTSLAEGASSITDVSQVPAVVRRALETEDRSVVVRTKTGRNLGHADIFSRLTDILKSDKHKDDMKKGVELHLYNFRLPRALIRVKEFKEVRRAIQDYENARQNAVGLESEGQPLEYLMCSQVDQYVKRPEGVKRKTLVEFKINEYLATKEHYDGDRGQDEGTMHARRVLLCAECQIGKTGSYLHLINLLRTQRRPDDAQINRNIFEEALGLEVAEPVSALHALFPYWRDLRAMPKVDYTMPRTGMYLRKAANQRLLLLTEACKQADQSWIKRYCDTLRGNGKLGELVLSKAGQDRLNGLEDRFEGEPSPISFKKGKAIVRDSAAIKAVLDWDGRLNHPDRYGKPAVLSSVVPADGQVMASGGTFVQDIWEAGTWDRLKLKDRPALAYKDSDGLEARQLHVHPSGTVAGSCGSQVYESNFAEHDKWNFCEGHPRFSVPESKRELFHLDEHRVIIKGRAEAASKLKLRWIFTPTYNRFNPGPNQAYLDRSEAMGLPSEDYVEVLVVRASQLENYRHHYQHTHVILALPRAMEVKYPSAPTSPTKIAETDGVGYARCVSQIVAHCLGLDAIWMLDDNVTRCYTLPRNQYKTWTSKEAKPQPERCSFGYVMQTIEHLVNDAAKKATPFSVPGLDQRVHVKSCARAEDTCAPSELLRRRKHDASRRDFQKPSTLAQFSGAKAQFGIIGCHRNELDSEVITKLFNISHSIYSFFLLNVEATVSKGLFYPAKTWLEDIEFVNMLDESGLVAVKLNHMFHHKKFFRLRSASAIKALPKKQAQEQEQMQALKSFLGTLGNCRKEKLLPSWCFKKCLSFIKEEWLPKNEASANQTILYVVERLDPSALDLVQSMLMAAIKIHSREECQQIAIICKAAERSELQLTDEYVTSLDMNATTTWVGDNRKFWAMTIPIKPLNSPTCTTAAATGSSSSTMHMTGGGGGSDSRADDYNRDR